MTRLLLFAASIALLGAAGAAAQGIYRWTDEKGKIHYGSTPPAHGKAAVLRERISSYEGPVQVQRAPAPAQAGKAGKPAIVAGPVVMYATDWCGYCAKARAYFARNGIAYVEHDVEKSASANAEFKRLGGNGVPLIVHGGQKMSGFSEQGFESLVARSAR